MTQIESHTQALEIAGEYKIACVYSCGNPTIYQFISKLYDTGIPIVGKTSELHIYYSFFYSVILVLF